MVLRFNIPDDKVDLLIDAICSNYAYVDTMPDGTPNPTTKAQFAKAMIVQYLRDQLKIYITKTEQNNLSTTVETQVNAANITSL
jgi:hypothetical protein